jgi:peptidoglycan/LPS O-acetylase OafA/YrhL
MHCQLRTHSYYRAMNTRTARPRYTFHTLNAMRGLAALIIVTGHTQPLFGGSLFPLGYLALDFFFMLSGFVLAHAYSQRLEAGLTNSRFMIARLIRLYPLYLVALAVAISAMIIERAHGGIYGKLIVYWALFELFFLPVPGRGAFPLFPLNSPAWSLFFELIANAGFGAFHRTLTDNKLALLVAALALMLNGTALYYGTLNIGFRWEHGFGGLPRVGFAFFAGVGLYRMWTKKSVRLPPRFFLGVMTLFGALLCIQLTSIELPVSLLAVLIVIPLIIYLGACCAISGVTSRVAAGLGASSYALYVIHEPIYRFISLAYPDLAESAASMAPWSGIAFLLACFGLALVLEHFVHIPAARFFSSSRLTSATTGAPLD